MIAYIAIKRHKFGGATFAYLPDPQVVLPDGWTWLRGPSGLHVTESIDDIGSPDMSQVDRCRLMSEHTGIVL